MSRRTPPGNKKRQPLPEGYRYSKDGKPLSPLEQFGNVIDAICDDENFDKAVEEGWNELSEEERNRRLGQVRDFQEKLRLWVEKLQAEAPPNKGRGA